MSRRNTNNVSLFPFLAVLVCAMGALILLLLVTTRRIRSDQLQQLQTTDEAGSELAEPAVLEPPPVSPTLAEIKVPTREPQVFPDHPALIVRAIPPAVADPSRDEQHEQRDLAALRGYGAMLQDQIAKSKRSKQQMHAKFASLRTEKDKLNEAAKKLDQQASNTKIAREDVEETQQRLDGQLAALRRAIEQQESEPVNAVSKYRIVPFDGISGTIRRPIMIECDGNRFRFIPEDVQLSQAEVESFVAGFNPLLSGTAALVAYWAKKDRESGESVGDPYVLLVVRPGGSMGFYTAKRMLRSLKLPIGYELVPEGRELDLPAADPIAARLCRQAVETTLQQKDRIRSLEPLTKSLLAQVERDRARGFGTPPGSSAEEDPSLTDERARRFRRMITQAPDPFSNGVPRRTTPSHPAPVPRPRRRLGHLQQGPSPSAQVPPDPAESEQAGSNQPRTLPFLEGSSGTPMQTQPPPGVVAMPGPISPDRRTKSSVARELTELPEYKPRSRRGSQAATHPLQEPRAQNAAPPLVPPADPRESRDPTAFGQGAQTPDQKQPPTPRLPPGLKPNQPGASTAGKPSVVTDSSTRQQQPNSSADEPPTPADPNQPQVYYRRAVSLVVMSNAVAVGSNKPVAIEDAKVSGPWLGSILTQIEAQVRAWGEAPRGMQWAPEVRFRVTEGAEKTHGQLRDALRRLGIRTTDEVAKPTKPAAGSGPVIQQQSGTRWRTSRSPIRRAGGSR